MAVKRARLIQQTTERDPEMEKRWQRHLDAAAEGATPRNGGRGFLVSVGDKQNQPVSGETFPKLRQAVEVMFPYEAFVRYVTTRA